MKWLPFFNILENFSANEREQIFREFLRNPGIFWLGEENTGNFETKNNLKGRDNNDRSRKATKPHEYVRRWQNEKQKYVPLFSKNSADRIFFFRKGTLFGTRNGEWGFRREGRGRVKPNFFIARGELAFLFRQTDYLAPFFIQSISPFSDTPSSTLFLAKFFVYVTSGWKFDRKDQTSLSLKIASGGSNSIVFQNSRRIFIDMLHLYGTRGEY